MKNCWKKVGHILLYIDCNSINKICSIGRKYAIVETLEKMERY